LNWFAFNLFLFFYKEIWEKMKNLLLILITSVAIFSACTSEPPSVRVLNRRTNKANVQIKSANGNTINFNNVETNQTTSYQEISEGYQQATAVIQNESFSPYIFFTTIKGRKYTIVVLDGEKPTLRVDDDGN
jgi:hypothetical protein